MDSKGLSEEREARSARLEALEKAVAAGTYRVNTEDLEKAVRRRLGGLAVAVRALQGEGDEASAGMAKDDDKHVDDRDACGTAIFRPSLYGVQDARCV